MFQISWHGACFPSSAPWTAPQYNTSCVTCSCFRVQHLGQHPGLAHAAPAGVMPGCCPWCWSPARRKRGSAGYAKWRRILWICIHTYTYIFMFYFLLSPKCIFKAEVVSKTSVSSNHLPEVWENMEKLESLYRGTKGKRGDRTEHDEYVNEFIHTKMHHIKIYFMDRHRLFLWNHFIIKPI